MTNVCPMCKYDLSLLSLHVGCQKCHFPAYSGKALQGAWKKGALARRAGQPREAPYLDKRTDYHEGVTFSRAFINAWEQGWDAEKKGFAKAVPA